MCNIDPNSNTLKHTPSANNQANSVHKIPIHEASKRVFNEKNHPSNQTSSKKKSCKQIIPSNISQKKDSVNVVYYLLKTFFADPRTNTQKDIGYFFIPSVLFPQDIHQCMMNNATEDAIRIARLSPEERMKNLQPNPDKLPVDEVTSINPFRTRKGMKGTTFLQKHDATFQKYFENVIQIYRQKHNLLETAISSENTKKHSSVKITPLLSSSNVRIESREQAERHFEEIHDKNLSQNQVCDLTQECNVLNEKLITLYQSIAQVAETAQSIPPHEPLKLIAETLCLALIQRLSEKLNKQDMAKEWLVLCLEVRSNLFNIFNYKNNGIDPSASLDKILEQLICMSEKCEKYLKEPPPLASSKKQRRTWNRTWKNFQKFLTDFHGWLQAGRNLTSEVPREKFYEAIMKFHRSSLKDIGMCTVVLNSRQMLEGWFSRRLNHLEYSLNTLPDVCEQKNVWQKNVEEISLEVNNQNWLRALAISKTVKDAIIQYGSVLASTPEILNNIPEYENAYLSSLTIACALKDDFNNLLSKDNLYKAFSQEAYEQLQILIPEVSKSKALAVKECEDLNLALDKLHAMHQELAEWEKTSTSLKELKSCIHNESYADFPDLYVKTYEDIAPFFKKWELGLKELNILVRKIQDSCFTTLANSPLKDINLEDLRHEFETMNGQILNLIKPSVLFLNAFQQLIHLDNSFISGSGKGNGISLPFAEEGELKVNLFQTSQKQFKNFARELQQFYTLPIQKDSIVEAKEEPLTIASAEKVKQEVSSDLLSPAKVSTAANVSLPSTVLAQNNENSLGTKIAEVFASTKTRKITNALLQLFKEYNVQYSVKTGKGSHTQIIIDGVHISLPKHKEWKPGTAHSIKSAVENQISTKK